MEKNKGDLYLLSADLGSATVENIIPQGTQNRAFGIKYFIAENIRTARRFLKKVNKAFDIDSLTFFELNKHTDLSKLSTFLAPASKGHDIGLLSEAGNPCVADPGSTIVRLAHERDIRVIPTVGPSSVILALMASGLNGQNFAFNGYLPIDSKARNLKIKALEHRSQNEKQSQIFMEAPFRNEKLLNALLSTCFETTKLCIAADISLETEFILTRTIKTWKKNPPDIQKRPSIFILQG
jgi:16S rRNA (cytidine1402-2'-O)-methyltransferase